MDHHWSQGIWITEVPLYLLSEVGIQAIKSSGTRYRFLQLNSATLQLNSSRLQLNSSVLQLNSSVLQLNSSVLQLNSSVTRMAAGTNTKT